MGRPPIRDHPRACGEKRSAQWRLFRVLGSPPRVRGKGKQSIDYIEQLGITPARAGKRA